MRWKGKHLYFRFPRWTYSLHPWAFPHCLLLLSVKWSCFWGENLFSPQKTDLTLEVKPSLPLIKMWGADFICPECKGHVIKKTLNTQLKWKGTEWWIWRQVYQVLRPLHLNPISIALVQQINLRWPMWQRQIWAATQFKGSSPSKFSYVNN